MRACLIAMLFIAAGCARSAPGTARTYTIDITPMAGPATTEQASTIDLGVLGVITVPANHRVYVSAGDARTPTPADSGAVVDTSLDDAGAASGNAGRILVITGATFWIGLVLVIAGGVIWLAKRRAVTMLASAGATPWLSLVTASLPPGTGVLVASTGAVIMVLPWLLETVGPAVQFAGYGLAAVAVVYAAWWATSYRRNKNNESARTE